MNTYDYKPNIRGFRASFNDQSVLIAGGTFPAGFFAADVLNLDRDFTRELYTHCKPVGEAYKQIEGGKFDPDILLEAAPHILKILEMIIRIKPFSMFDNSRVIKQTSANLYENYYTKLNMMGTASCGLLAKQNEQAVKQTLLPELSYYANFADALCSCINIIARFCDMKLSALDKCDKPNIAKAWFEYYGDHNSRKQRIYFPFCTGSRIPYDKTRFGSFVHSDMLFDVRESAENGFSFSRSYHFDHPVAFLSADFLEGLIAGRYPRRCNVCDRYFLMENARRQKYCNGYFPGDEKGRTCRAVAAKRKEKERAEAHPVKTLYRTRCNTIDHHRRAGLISEEKATKAKEIACDKMYRALRDNEYFLNEYAKEMAQDAIYAEADALIGEGCSD